MEEVYTIRELAALVGAPWQTVAAWKRNGQIPAKAVTPEGKIIKSVIGPLVEAYKNAPPQPTPSNKRKSKMGNSFSPEIREKAVRMFKQGQSQRKIAKKLGCAPETVRRWKQLYEESIAARPIVENDTPNEKATIPKKAKSVEFEEFVRGYWQEGTRAVDVLLLPPEIGPLVLNYVNEALKYAYERLR